MTSYAELFETSSMANILLSNCRPNIIRTEHMNGVQLLKSYLVFVSALGRCFSDPQKLFKTFNKVWTSCLRERSGESCKKIKGGLKVNDMKKKSH